MVVAANCQCCLLQLRRHRYFIGLGVSSRNEQNLNTIFEKHTKRPLICNKYHQTKWRVPTTYPIITVQKSYYVEKNKLNCYENNFPIWTAALIIVSKFYSINLDLCDLNRVACVLCSVYTIQMSRIKCEIFLKVHATPKKVTEVHKLLTHIPVHTQYTKYAMLSNHGRVVKDLLM